MIRKKQNTGEKKMYAINHRKNDGTLGFWLTRNGSFVYGFPKTWKTRTAANRRLAALKTRYPTIAFEVIDIQGKEVCGIRQPA